MHPNWSRNIAAHRHETILRYALVVSCATALPLWMAHRTPDKAAVLVFPTSRAIIVRTPSTTITAEYDTVRVREILVLRPFSANRALSIDQPQKKMAFARELYSLIPKDVFLSKISMRSNRDSLGFQFPLEMQIDIKRFWESAELQRIWTSVHNPKAATADVRVIGWVAASFHSTAETRHNSGKFFSLSVSLKPGLNDFQLMLLDSSERVIMIDSLSIYYSIPTSTDSPPDGFTQEVFHSSPLEEQCASCHTEISSTCTSCHQGLIKLASMHPAAEDCSLCHDLSSSKESKLVEGQDFGQELCFTCHDDKKELLETKPVVHGTASECLMCHNPHGSTFDALLRDRTTNICKTCHEEKANEQHPVAGHPMEGPRDPYRPGKKLTCTSCHNPHASDHAKLFRFPTLPICSHCHAKG